MTDELLRSESKQSIINIEFFFTVDWLLNFINYFLNIKYTV